MSINSLRPTTPATANAGAPPPRQAPQKAVKQATKDASAVRDGLTTLATIKNGDDLLTIAPERWASVASYVLSLPGEQRAKLASDMVARGVILAAQPSIGEVSLMSGDAFLTIDAQANEVRISTDNNAGKIYKGAQVVETLTPAPGKDKVQVTFASGASQVWDMNTGKGTTPTGQPLPVRYADPVAGEAARKPWDKPIANRFVMPPDTDDSTATARRHLNEAVVKAGGEVVEAIAANTPDVARYNCHSFAVTGGHGDIADPFDGLEQPRWVNFPTFQLTNGPFKRLQDDQKVHVGDVILYANKAGQPTHTGKVTAVDDDGNPSQIESKWGTNAIFKHAPFDIPKVYGHIDGFYRPDPAP